MAVKENLKVGRADVEQTQTAHIRGVSEGNAVGSYGKMDGHNSDGTSSARRSTGINADARNPILPDMPNLSPA